MTRDEARMELANALENWHDYGGDVMRVIQALESLVVLSSGGIVK